MKVTPLHDAEPRERLIAVGTFDGVHVGHRAVIADADTVLTFDPHPVEVLAPDKAPRLLTTSQRKAELVEGLGVQEMVVIPFDAGFAAQSPQEFVDDVLVQRLGAVGVRVGRNFRFGQGAAGDVAMLESQDAFETTAVDLLEQDGQAVSSSWIRELVATGEVARAAQMLGSEFEVAGTVTQGDRRGRELGYPTANIVPPARHVIPAHGIYAARALLENGSEVPAAVSIGLRPTFETDLGELVEAYLIDFDGDLYGQDLRLRFVEFIRPEAKFDDVDALIRQMGADVDAARSALAGS